MKFDGSTWTQYRTPEGFVNCATSGVVVDRNNIVWYGTNGAGLWSYNGTKWTIYRDVKSEFSSDYFRVLASDYVNALALDEKGTLWVSSARSLNSFDGTVWKTYPLGKDIPPLSLTGLTIDPREVKWFGSDRGLISFDGAAWKLYDRSNSGIPGDVMDGYTTVRTVLADEKGVIWLSTGAQGEYTDKNGLTSFDGTTWKTITLPGIGGNVVNSVVVDKNNVKWFATSNENSLSSFDGTSWKKYPEGPITQAGNSIMVDSQNRSWFCTNTGVSCLDGALWKNYTTADGLPGGAVYAAAEDDDGILWFGTDQGACSFDGLRWTSYNEVIKSMGGNPINSLAVDQGNVKWFGSNGYGVLSFDGKTWRHFTSSDGLSGDHVRTIAVDKNNIVWLGTGTVVNSDRGLSCFDGRVWKAWSYTPGVMPVWSAVTGIAVDRDNVKWIVDETDSAVYSFDGISWKTYNSQWSGNGGYLSIAIDNDGVKWLGSKNIGAVSFRESEETPTIVSSGNVPPKAAAITGIYPNPFNPSTTIEFILPSPGNVTLDVYDIMGRIVRRLLSMQVSAGKCTVLWDGRDDSGRSVSSGVYISLLTMGNQSIMKKMLLMK